MEEKNWPHNSHGNFTNKCLVLTCLFALVVVDANMLWCMRAVFHVLVGDNQLVVVEADMLLCMRAAFQVLVGDRHYMMDETKPVQEPS